jgi:hypothetical protein
MNIEDYIIILYNKKNVIKKLMLKCKNVKITIYFFII